MTTIPFQESGHKILASILSADMSKLGAEIHEVLDGKAVDWLEKVSDAQYNQYNGTARAR